MAELYGIERFFLYGEPPRPAGARFVHLELLDDRSRPANWVIRPHSHPDLHQIFLVDGGGGNGDGDSRRLRFEAPCIVAVPAGVVHGFHWVEGAAGRVLTVSDPFFRSIAAGEARLGALFDHGMWTASTLGSDIGGAFARLERELGWAAIGHDFAIAAHLSTILVESLRLHHEVQQQSQAPPSPQAFLVARYRALLEAHFREHPPVEWSASRLGVSPSRLRAACRMIANASPVRLLQDRLRLEAERVMRYSNMSIAQVATYLGFADPAYFSRFFTREHGVSPRAFREDVRARI